MSQASFASARVAECRDDTGSVSRAKLQKPQRALQALVMAKWQVPGPPSQTASSAIFQIEGRFGAARAERSGIGVLVAIAAFFLATLSVAGIVLLCYRNADRVAQLVGQEGARVVTSLSAFLLLCVGVQIIAAGAIDLARLAIAQG